MAEYKLLCGDVLDVLPTLAEQSIHCAVTSPPYFGLRDYGLPKSKWAEVEYTPMTGLPTIIIPAWEGCLGLEPTIEMYVGHMVLVCRQLWRVLRDDGTFWLNVGDTYAASRGYQVPQTKDTNTKRYSGEFNNMGMRVPEGLKPKDLIGVPWRLAYALQADGWWLRMDNIWHKNNPMPESVTDRPTKAHEYVFLLSKSEKYFYDADAIREPMAPESVERYKYVFGGNKNEQLKVTDKPTAVVGTREATNGRNKRSVWTVPTKPYSEAHFATFPSELIEPCVLAGTSEKGCCAKCGSSYERIIERTGAVQKREAAHTPNSPTKVDSTGWMPATRPTNDWQPTCKCNANTAPCTVLDLFNGSGTTGVVCMDHKRDYVGIELNPAYVNMADRRIGEVKGYVDMQLDIM